MVAAATLVFGLASAATTMVVMEPTTVAATTDSTTLAATTVYGGTVYGDGDFDVAAFLEGIFAQAPNSTQWASILDTITKEVPLLKHAVALLPKVEEAIRSLPDAEEQRAMLASVLDRFPILEDLAGLIPDEEERKAIVEKLREHLPILEDLVRQLPDAAEQKSLLDQLLKQYPFVESLLSGGQDPMALLKDLLRQASGTFGGPLQIFLGNVNGLRGVPRSTPEQVVPTPPVPTQSEFDSAPKASSHSSAVPTLAIFLIVAIVLALIAVSAVLVLYATKRQTQAVRRPSVVV